MNSTPARIEDGGHRPADLPGAALGLLGQHADAVEAEEGQHRDRHRARDQRPGERVGVVERLPAEPAPARGESPAGDGQEDRQDDQLADQHHPGDHRGHPDPDRVDDRVDRDEPEQPQPHRHRRDGGVHRHRRHQVQQPRHEHVVEQDHPAGQEPDRRADAPAGVVVDAARHRERLHHLRVRERGEHQRHHTDRVRQGHHPAGAGVHAAEDRHRRDRHHVHQPVGDQVPEPQPPGSTPADSRSGPAHLAHTSQTFRM